MTTRWVQASGIIRFIRYGLDDAAARVSRVTAPLAPFEPTLAKLFKESRLVARAQAAMRLAETALGASRTAAAATAWAGRVQPHVGIVLVIAAVTHLLLLVTHAVPAGWLWLVPPAAAALAGALLIAAGPGRRAPERSA